MRIQKKKGRAVDVRKIKREMYLASLAKLDDAYCDAARKYEMPVRRFALLMVSTYSMSRAYTSHQCGHWMSSQIFWFEAKVCTAVCQFAMWQASHEPCAAKRSERIIAQANNDMSRSLVSSLY